MKNNFLEFLMERRKKNKYIKIENKSRSKFTLTKILQLNKAKIFEIPQINHNDSK